MKRFGLVALAASLAVSGAAFADNYYYRAKATVAPPAAAPSKARIDFSTLADMGPGESGESSPVQLTALTEPLAATADGGTFRVCSAPETGCGNWVGSGTVSPGDWIQLRASAGDDLGSERTVRFSTDAAGGSWTVTTRSADRDAVPDQFVFANASGVTRSISVVSAPVPVSGFDVHLAASISGGEFRSCGASSCGAWSTAGRVRPGESVQARITSSASYSTAVSATLRIGTTQATWTVTTEATPVISTPNAFSFANVSGIEPSSTQDSGYAQITGINVAVPITATGGYFRTCTSAGGGCGSWLTNGTVLNNEWIQLRQASSGSLNTSTSVSVNVGGVSRGWSVTTRGSNGPDPFTISSVTGTGNPSSNKVRVTGSASSYPITVTGGGSNVQWMQCATPTTCPGFFNSTGGGTFTTGYYLWIRMTLPSGRTAATFPYTIKMGDYTTTVYFYRPAS